MQDTHTFFVLACYGASLLVLGLLTGWIVLDGRLTRRRLTELEARGIRRRSAREP